MFALCASVLLYLMSVSDSAPLTCEDLVRPLDQLEPHHLEGRFVFVAASINNPVFLEIFKRRDSVAIDFTNRNGTSAASFTRNQRFGDKCRYHSSNVSIEGGTLTFDDVSPSNLTGTFLRTSCSDCLVIHFSMDLKTRVHVFLVSRRREVGQKEMEEYKAQLECLQLPPPVVLDPTKELCPSLERYFSMMSSRIV